jgi:hypothetical protein
MNAGVSGDAQSAANQLVNAAQEIANSAIDLGEEAAGSVLDAVITANSLLGGVLETLKGKLVG